ncbi:hypothetical protein IEZ26_19140 [Nocardioides cavernae]|uniref:WxL domain-containing protein n=1 Tax=Nocardioides cavernae TaxID=1921566 RepID=A0ABR8NF36_9ACTN|nr:hypothetical protein [Nocardioides cavernae]MBD3926743.1 hypothetical protein [Nocardioides cavernae]MBM7512465.1 hypothetical protein [Nocardioides cavernae]
MTTVVAGGLAVLGAAPASAATPTGGCWVYSPTTPSNIEDTVPASQTSSTLAPWANPGPADYTLTSSGSNAVGGTRNFSMTFNEGPTNGGPPASGTVYYYFSVNGTNLPAISKAFSAGGAAPIPGDTINGSYNITAAGTQNIVLRKVYYDIPSFLTRVACNGQATGVRINPSGGVNPATTPVDTNITTSFTAVNAPAASITAVSNQTVTTHARRNDVISFSVTDFTDGSASAQLCDSAGNNCDTGTSSFTVTGGAGTGTLNVGASPTTGSRRLKVTSGADTRLVPITILANVTFNITATGNNVTFSGSNWDPNQSVSVGGYLAPPPIPPNPTSDAPTTVTADSTGAITGSFTVSAGQSTVTAFIGASRIHANGPPPTVLFASQSFGDACVAKVGTATTGSCSLVETVNLTVNAGDLKMSKVSGPVVMSAVTLDGTATTSSGSLQDVTVKDYRGGTLGWSLVGRFSGLSNGGFSITPDKLTWAPTCTAGGNNNDTVTAGAGGAFADSATALPLCSVVAGGFGADGTSGGDTVADAGLTLAVAANQAAGSYTGTITLTLS